MNPRLRAQNIKALSEILEEDLATIRAEFERLDEENKMVDSLLDARHDAGLSQQEIADASGLGIEKIIEMESGNDAGLNMNDVKAYLKAAGKTLRVSAIPRRSPRTRPRRSRPVSALA